MGKRCLPKGKQDIDTSDVGDVGSVDCVSSRVYFSMLYEEDDLFSKTEVIFLTNIVTSK